MTQDNLTEASKIDEGLRGLHMRIPPTYAIVLLASLVFFMKRADAQNLLANGGFEDINTCYEYNATCSPAAWFVVTPTKILNRPSREGKRALAFCFDNFYTPSERIFPYTKLLCPLKAGNKYILRLWINTGKYEFSHLDVLCTSGDPSRINNINGRFEPTFQFDNSNIVQKENSGWMLLNKQFVPDQDYNFLLLGNLLNNTVYAKPKKNTAENSGNIIYQVDEINLTANDSSLNKCPRYEETVKQLYAETRRHSAYFYLDEKRAPLVKERTRSPDTSGKHVPLLKSDTLVIPGVLFETNSSVIDTGYQVLLEDLILKIKDKDIRTISINGHTDNTGTVELNKKLSLKRATAVGEYLTNRLSKLKPIITENGYGDTRPVAPNNIEVNKAQNRRVEIILNYFPE